MRKDAARDISFNESKGFSPLCVTLIGQENLQNRVICDLISQQTSAQHCLNTHIIDLKDLPKAQVTLFDCKLFSVAQLELALEHLTTYQNDACIALLNAEKHSAYEELAQWPQVKAIFCPQQAPKQLIRGINEILDGGQWLPRHILHQLIDLYRKTPKRASNLNNLTAREKQILSMVTQASTNQQIATHLHVSEHTVKTHIYNIFKKLNVKNRIEACAWANEYLIGQ